MALAIIFLLPKREPLRYKKVLEFFTSFRYVRRRNSVGDSIENSDNNAALIKPRALDGNSVSTGESSLHQA